MVFLFGLYEEMMYCEAGAEDVLHVRGRMDEMIQMLYRYGYDVRERKEKIVQGIRAIEEEIAAGGKRREETLAGAMKQEKHRCRKRRRRYWKGAAADRKRQDARDGAGPCRRNAAGRRAATNGRDTGRRGTAFQRRGSAAAFRKGSVRRTAARNCLGNLSIPWIRYWNFRDAERNLQILSGSILNTTKKCPTKMGRKMIYGFFARRLPRNTIRFIAMPSLTVWIRNCLWR